MHKKSLALFILAADGINSYSAGVGTTVSGLLNSLSKLEIKLSKINLLLKLYLITPYLQDGYEYKNNEIIYNNKLIEIDNNTDGIGSFGTQNNFINNWNTASDNAALEISKYIDYDNINIIICIDTPFLKVASYLKQKNLLQNQVYVILAPQSTEISHQTNIKDRY